MITLLLNEIISAAGIVVCFVSDCVDSGNDGKIRFGAYSEFRE